MSANRFGLFAGIVLVVGGLLLLAGSIFNFNAWAYCWPVALIALGVWFVMRPAAGPNGGVSTIRFIGELHRSGPWRMVNEDFSQLIGDIDLDLTQAQIASGETRLQFSGFVGDVTLQIPAGVGLMISASCFVSDLEFLGQRRQAIFSPLSLSTPGYAEAERRLRLEFNFFVADLNIRQG